MDVVLVGLNHRTAPVEVRERVAFAESEAPGALARLRGDLGIDETFLLSTCNRTEVVGVARANGQIEGSRLLNSLRPLRPSLEALSGEMTYELHGVEAVRHLLRVASGLDSMVLGEPQILAQLRQAYTVASETGATGLYLNKILHIAFRTGRRVRTETELGYGAVSVAYAAATLARKVFGDFSRHTALVIGAGEMAETAARHLRELGIKGLIFVNRTEEKAGRLALEFEGEALPFSNLVEALMRADIVISSTGAPGFILTHELFHRVMDQRHTRPIFLVDIAVPRDIDPDINDHDNAFLYDIDSLQEVADRNLERRRAAIPAAEAIIERELAAYDSWLQRRKVEPIVRLLQERFDNVRKCEVQRSLKRFHDEEGDDLEAMTAAIQKKLLHRPMEVLRECDPETEEGQRVLELVRNLFDLK